MKKSASHDVGVIHYDNLSFLTSIRLNTTVEFLNFFLPNSTNTCMSVIQSLTLKLKPVS